MKYWLPGKYNPSGITIGSMKTLLRDQIVDEPTPGYDVLVVSTSLSPAHPPIAEVGELIRREKKPVLIYNARDEAWDPANYLRKLMAQVGGFDYRVVIPYCPIDLERVLYDPWRGQRIPFDINFDHVGGLPLITHGGIEWLNQHVAPPRGEYSLDVFAAMSTHPALVPVRRAVFFGAEGERFDEHVVKRFPASYEITLREYAGAEGYRYTDDEYIEKVRDSKVTLHIEGNGLWCKAYYQDSIAGGLSLRMSTGLREFFVEPGVHFVQFDFPKRFGEEVVPEDYDDFIEKLGFALSDGGQAVRRCGHERFVWIINDLLAEESEIVDYSQKAFKLLMEGSNELL